LGEAVISCIVGEVIQILVVFAMISHGDKPVDKLAGLGLDTRWAYDELRHLLVEGWLRLVRPVDGDRSMTTIPIVDKKYQIHTIVQKPMSFLHANPPNSPLTMVALEADGSSPRPPPHPLPLDRPHQTLQSHESTKLKPGSPGLSPQ